MNRNPRKTPAGWNRPSCQTSDYWWRALMAIEEERVDRGLRIAGTMLANADIMPGSLPSHKGVQQYNFHFRSKGKRFPCTILLVLFFVLLSLGWPMSSTLPPSLDWSHLEPTIPLPRSFSIRVEYSLWRATIIDVTALGSRSSRACRFADTSEVMACALFENPPSRTILPRDDVIYHFLVRLRSRLLLFKLPFE